MFADSTITHHKSCITVSEKQQWPHKTGIVFHGRMERCVSPMDWLSEQSCSLLWVSSWSSTFSNPQLEHLHFWPLDVSMSFKWTLHTIFHVLCTLFIKNVQFWHRAKNFRAWIPLDAFMSRVAQRKHAGSVTHRSVDWSNPLLTASSCGDLFPWEIKMLPTMFECMLELCIFLYNCDCLYCSHLFQCFAFLQGCFSTCFFFLCGIMGKLFSFHTLSAFIWPRLKVEKFALHNPIKNIPRTSEVIHHFVFWLDPSYNYKHIVFTISISQWLVTVWNVWQ